MFKTNKKLPDEITIDPDVNEIDPNLLKKIDNQFAGNFGIKAKDSQAFRIWIDPNETNGEKHSMIRVGGDTTIGVLNLINRNDRSSFLANGEGQVEAGGNGFDANVRIKNKDDKTVIDLKGGTRGDLYIRDGENEDIIHLSGAGTISVGGKGHWARITSVSSDDKEVLVIDGGGITLGGNGYGGIIRFLSLKNKDKKEEVTVIDGQGNISLGGYGFYGQLIIKDVNGRVTSHIDGGGRIFAGTQSPPYPGYKGEIFLYDTNGRERIHLDGGLGKMVLNDINGQERILLDGETCDITLSGADCAEEFDVTENEDINPGTVLVINDDGKLSPSEKPYDKRVAGVVSGGEGYHPGIILDKNPNQNKRLPLALTGKTYCRVDAQHAPIELGDLLTTSSTPGHAMKACDPLRAFGSVIGKALRSHKENSGMIPILVALQ